MSSDPLRGAEEQLAEHRREVQFRWFHKLLSALAVQGPEGGLRVVNPSDVTDEQLQSAIARLRDTDPEFAEDHDYLQGLVEMDKRASEED